MYAFTIRCRIGSILYHETGFNAMWKASTIGLRVCREAFPGNRLTVKRETT